MKPKNKYRYDVAIANDKMADGYEMIHFDAIASTREDNFVMFQAVERKISINTDYVIWVIAIPIEGKDDGSND